MWPIAAPTQTLTSLMIPLFNNSEMEYRKDIENLASWCQNSNLDINASKDERVGEKQAREHSPILIDRVGVEIADIFKFLGIHITRNLTSSPHTDVVIQKVNQRIYYLKNRKIQNIHKNSLEPFTAHL